MKQKEYFMKQFLKSTLCTALLLSTAVADARRSSDDCRVNNFCNTGCNTNCNSTNTNCNTNCNTNFCNTGCNTNNFCNTGCNTNNFCNTGCNTGCGRGSDRCGRGSDRCRRRSDDCFSCDKSCGTGYVNFRNVGSNTARHLVGWQTEINRADVGEPYGAVALTYEYERSFRGRRIARSLFGTDTLTFVGSQVPGTRPVGAFVADYFGLPANSTSSVRFRPRIQNHILELSAYYNFSDCPEGAWIQLHAPVAFTKWNLCPQFCDQLCSATLIQPFPVCTFSTTATVAAATSLGAALTGQFTGVTECTNFFDSLCSRKKTRLADIELQFGYNFYNDDCGHAGLYLITLLPTGNKPKGHAFFEPVVGNGGHFELGLGLSAHTILWDDQCDQSLGLWFDGYVTHLFNRKQCRTLDFCLPNGRFSRFLLLREFQADQITPTGRLVSATCFNRRNVDVRVNVKGDASLKLAYRMCGFGVDLGYNIYGHSREKVRFRNNCQPCDSNGFFGIAGTSGVCCTSYPVAPSGACTVIAGPATGTNPLNATFSHANIFTPTTGVTPDNPVFFTGATGQTPATSVCLVTGTTALPGTIVPTFTATGAPVTCPGVPGAPGTLPASALAPVSSSPVLVNQTNLDPRSAQACAVLTHKVFGHLSYTWADDCGYNPQIGVGGEVEFEKSCERPSLNQWGVWIKLVGSF